MDKQVQQGFHLNSRRIVGCASDLLCHCISTPLVKYPFFMKTNGIVGSSLIVMFMGWLLAPYSVLLLLFSMTAVESETYSDLHLNVLSPFSFTILRISDMILTFLGILNNINLSKLWIQDIFSLAPIPSLCTLVVLYTTSLLVSLNAKRFAGFTKNINLVVICIMLFMTLNEAMDKPIQTTYHIEISSELSVQFSSIGLIFLSFHQLRKAVDILAPLVVREAKKTYLIILLNSMLSTSIYLTVGILGYFAYNDTGVNWISAVQNDFFRNTVSSLFLAVNILVFSRVVSQTVTYFIGEQCNSKQYPFQAIISTLITVMLSFCAEMLIPSVFSSLLSILFGSISVMIFPTLVYLKTRVTYTRTTLIAFLLLVLGCCFAMKSLFEIVICTTAR